MPAIAIPAIAAIGGAAIGGIMQNRATGQAVSAQNHATDMAAQVQREALQQQQANMQPYQDLFNGAYGQLRYGTKVKDRLGEQTADRMAGVGNQYAPGRPDLASSVNYNPNMVNVQGPTSLRSNVGTQIHNPNLQDRIGQLNIENDPIYQAQKNEMMQTLNRRAASQGKFNSSDADNAIVRNLSPLMQDSYGRQLTDMMNTNQNEMARYSVTTDQFGRDLTQLGLANQNLMTKYGMETDKYNRLTSEMERGNQNALSQYGFETDQYNRRMGEESNRYNLINSDNDRYYGKLIDAAKMGQGAASSINASTQNAAGNMANAYNQQGSNLAQLALARGNNNADMVNTAIAGGLGAYNNYNLGQMLNQGYQYSAADQYGFNQPKGINPFTGGMEKDLPFQVGMSR